MSQFRLISITLFITLCCLITAGCVPTSGQPSAVVDVKPTGTLEATETATAVPSPTSTPEPSATPTLTPTPTITPSPTFTPTPDAETLFEEKMAQGKSYAEEDYWEKAAETFLEAIALDPDNGRAYNNLGLSYHMMGELELAFANFDQAISLDPDKASYYANRGDAWRDNEEVEKALTDYDQAISLDPETPRFFYNRAIVYKWLGETENAIADYDQAIELDPEFAYAYHNRANLYWNIGNYDQAIADFDKALEFDSTDKLGLRNRGLLHLELANFEEAHADFSQIISLCDPITIGLNDGQTISKSFDGNCTYAYLLRAETEYEIGNFGTSITDLQMGISDDANLAFNYFDRVFSNNPNDGFAVFGRGLARVNFGESEEAQADYTRAIQLSGSDPMRQNYYLARGVLYLTQGNLESAIADWQQTLSIAPDNADAYFNLGMAYQEMGDYETAVTTLRAAIAQDMPDDYRLNLAYNLIYNAELLLYASENDQQTELAVSTYELVLNKIPDIEVPAGVFNNLCWGASLQGMANEVMDACKLAVEMEPANGGYRDSRGLARALTGDFAGAIEDFQYYISWDPENQSAQEDINLRKKWVEALENGVNPFDGATLELLRGNLQDLDYEREQS